MLFLAVAGCEQLENRLGLESAEKKNARLEAEGTAVGGACRQSGRAIEDCYAIYTWVPKEAIFSGWREMDEYMRENNLDTITPLLPPPPPPEAGKKKRKATPAQETEGNEAAPPAPIPVPVPAARVPAPAAPAAEENP
ncbi:MAG: hypothetical protein LBB55_01100 [Zoogloeaceae bacterium]|nr:hypothetical protein [Zoogloeaceae bacterium]